MCLLLNLSSFHRNGRSPYVTEPAGMKSHFAINLFLAAHSAVTNMLARLGGERGPVVSAASAAAAALSAVAALLLLRRRHHSARRDRARTTVSCCFRGPIVHSVALGKLEVLSDALLLVDAHGRIASLTDLSRLTTAEARAAVAAAEAKCGPGARVELLEPRASDDRGSAVGRRGVGRRMLVPGLVDGHAHAPQYVFAGTGMDLPLLKWLEKHTFPAESRFADATYARHVYQRSVRRSLVNGTTTCSWFATLHLEASKVLVDVVREIGQRAHVGKVRSRWLAAGEDSYCAGSW